MLKRLRTTIVLAIVLISSFMLTIALASVVYFDYHAELAQIHKALAQSLERNGVESPLIIGDAPQDDAPETFGQVFPFGRAAERSRPIARPVATFVLDEDGTVIRDNRSFVSMEADVRDRSISLALASKASVGRLSQTNVYYMRSTTADGHTAVAFADSSGLVGSTVSTIGRLALAELFVILGLLVLSVFVARTVTKPVERAWKAQKDFVANASHELKTPLTVILANTDILLHGDDLTEEQRSWLDRTKDEADHMKGLVTSMLELACDDNRPSEGKDDVRDTVDLSSLVKKTCLSFDAVAFEAGIDMTAEVEDGLSVQGNAEKLERLVKILVDNALKYAQAGGEVEVGLTVGKKGRASLSVRNTSQTIDPEDIPHVFERFWRSDRARQRDNGTSYGLGLAIAKSIADNHGAQISVASDDEKGTTFTVDF